MEVNMRRKIILFVLIFSFLTPTWVSAEGDQKADTSLFSAASMEAIIQDLECVQESAESMADMSRALGYDDSTDFIQALGKWWWECEDRIRYFQYIQLELTAENEMKETKADILAKIMRIEFGGADTNDPVWRMHAAAIGWCVLNRVDAGYGSLEQVSKAPNQFSYCFHTEVRDDLHAIATDVLIRWYLEKAEGYGTTGRVLGEEELYFWGDGQVNHYYSDYRNCYGSEWDWSLPNPYDTESTPVN
jgi:hypothetical protein